MTTDEYQVRLKRLANLREHGINPYPATAKRKQTIQEVLNGFDSLKEVAIVGRIRLMRSHGGSAFFNIEDGTSRIQCYIKKDVVGESEYEIFSLFDLGDFVACEGKPFLTKKGERTIEIQKIILLAKALRPLPEKFHGLEDIELKSRKRYLDLLANPESKKVFEIRSQTITLLRSFLAERGYVEVETPILQPVYGGGLARPFITHHNTLNRDLYLRISTELYLKRLIVGGFERVYEIGRVFRNEGVDKNHNPEFTILETMEAYADYKKNMELVEQMFSFVVTKIHGTTKITYQNVELDFTPPWRRITVCEAIKEVTGHDLEAITDRKEAEKIAKKMEVKIEPHFSVGHIIGAIFEQKVEKTLIQPTFVYNYPVETAPLAKRRADNPRFVERFEHYTYGWECSNNYSELNDPEDLRQRFVEERERAEAGDKEAHETDNDFLEAIEYGMPPTSGIGPGIDRFVMFLTNTANIRDVILFPILREK